MSDRIHPDDYDLDAVRAEFIGKLVSTSQARYPVEYDPIRRHCHMTGDRNPAYLDPEIAAQGIHGEVVVPPSMLPVYFATGGFWPGKPETPSDDEGDKRPGFTFGVPTPGDRGVNMSVAYEYREPIRVGDRLHAESRIADIFQKSINLDSEAVWIVLEASIFNQHDRVVATWKNTVLVHRSPQQVAQDAERSNA